MIQAALASKKLDNSDSLPEMKKLLEDYSQTKGDLNFLRAIHVAGSKGKGSVCAFTEQILRCKGFKTGMFTSPHLVHPRERIRINGKPVSEDIFAKHVMRIDSAMKLKGDLISFFRFLWILAIDIFKEANIDVGIIEVGMGGRFDATNVIDNPTVCGITSLSLEHVSLLGPTIRDIAWNKAGIIKSNIPVWSVKQSIHPETEEIIQREAINLGSWLYFVENKQVLKDSVQLGINGLHQQENAALASNLATTWIAKWKPESPLTESELKSALKLAFWPGRQQIFQVSNILTLFLDGSHTFESVSATADWFSNSAPQTRNILFFHCSLDRDYIKLLQPLLSIHSRFNHVYFMLPPSIPGEPLKLKRHHQEMAEYWTSRTGSPASVIDEIPNDIYNHPNNSLICGSLYLVGHFMKIFSIPT